MENNEKKNALTNKLGQGDFSLKRVGRKKKWDKKVILLVSGAVIFVIVFIFVFSAIVISSTVSDEKKVDESRVKESQLLKQQRKKDDSMRVAMEKQTNQPTPITPQPSVSEEEPKNTGARPPEVKITSDYQEVSEIPIAERQEEFLFSAVSRFDSGGASASAFNGTPHNTSAGSSSSLDSDETQLRAFAEADTEEEVRKLTGRNSGLMAGRTGGNSLLDNLSGAEYVKVKARLAPSPKYLLKRLTNFQCVLYTAIKTDYPGFVSCRLTRPLYSADGSLILAEAGAELTGEQRVEIKAGQTSVFTVWTELDTSPGVRASLNALGTDAMGRSGTDAYIDNHYGQRFGGAVMLSFVKDALASAANLTKKSGNGYNVSNSEHNAEDMASKALENSINIPPTGYVLPGTVLNVIVAHDIDFSSVYTTR